MNGRIEVPLEWPEEVRKAYVGKGPIPEVGYLSPGLGNIIKIPIYLGLGKGAVAYVFEVMCDNPDGNPPYQGKYLRTETIG